MQTHAPVLAEAMRRLADWVDSSATHDIDLGANDFYWAVQGADRSEFQERPHLEVGSLLDDLGRLRRVASGASPDREDLEHLAGVLRAVSLVLGTSPEDTPVEEYDEEARAEL